MSGYPLLVEGTRLAAVIVGGGTVAARKARALLATGATVRVIAPSIDPALRELADGGGTLAITERAYRSDDIGDAMLVIAATDSREVNAEVAREGMARGRLVMVADAPEGGNCTAPAVHRAGDLVVAVSAGGVPGAAARIRDAIAERFDDRYASALAGLREARLSARRAGTAAERRDRLADLTGPDFCSAVEGGAFTERLKSWR